MTDIKSPCKNCDTENAPDCRAKCKKLSDFVQFLDANPTLSYGISDTNDSIGYKLGE